VKGSHAIATGLSYTRAGVWLYNQQLVPTITLAGTVNGDPADAMFTTANFPSASATDLTNARTLYGVLTGRVTTIGRNARIGGDGNYTVLGASNQYGRLPQWGTFVQDAWRLKSNLTVNAGLRYDVQMPFFSLNDSYSMATVEDIFGVTGPGAGFVPGSTVDNLGNLFKPGVLQGSPTTVKAFPKGAKAEANGEAGAVKWVETEKVYNGKKAVVRTDKGVAQDFFTQASPPLMVGKDDKLFAYVYLDPKDPPKSIMLQFYDGTWEHRAYWGEDKILLAHDPRLKIFNADPLSSFEFDPTKSGLLAHDAVHFDDALLMDQVEE
jgi:hypothetical protein